MQIRCNVYGLTNASTGVECSIERSLLEIGEYFHYGDRDYVIVSVVESQGRWFANVVPENQRRFVRRPLPSPRFQSQSVEQENVQVWRERVAQAEHNLQQLREEQLSVGKRLDHLMDMLELLTREPETPQ